MSPRARTLSASLALAAGLTAPLTGRAAGPTPALSTTAARAFEMARSADDAAGQALEEGDKTLDGLKRLVPAEQVPEPLKPILAEGEAAHQALTGYRRQAQASAGEALQVLVEVSRVVALPTPDPIRRETLEQRALLAAHEAAVMSARARTEAERLRAVLAEARVLGAGGGRATGQGGAVAKTTPAPPSKASGLIEVPNLVGARLTGATRDLAAAGLRLGGTTGPRDGYVVKQVPEPGARVAPRSEISVVLSATAAATTVVTPH